MERLEITQVAGGLRIEGFPDAVGVMKIEGRKAQQLADLTLHLSDLGFSLECLNLINEVTKYVPEAQAKTIQRGLWHTAITHFLKCFGGNESRPFDLHADVIYRGQEHALEGFRYFRALRNKHLVHDENSYSQCNTGAILNSKSCSQKIAKVVSSSVQAKTLEQANYGNLHASVSTARQWVIGRMDALCQEISVELEGEAYDDLIGREKMEFAPARIEDIDKPR